LSNCNSSCEENLITNQVINWSYSSPSVRLDARFGVAYGSDLHAVRDLAIQVAKRTDRVLASPRPVCHVTGIFCGRRFIEILAKIVGNTVDLVVPCQVGIIRGWR
jgi:small-conductance mechanosensitive channel